MGTERYLNKQYHNYINSYYIDLKFHRSRGWPVLGDWEWQCFFFKLLLDSVQVTPQILP